MVPYILKENNIIVILKGKSYNINKDDANYRNLLEAIRLQDDDAIEKLLVPSEIVKNWSQINSNDNYDIILNDGILTIKDKILNLVYNVSEKLANKIKQMIDEKLSTMALCNFIANLNKNPSKRAVDELYGFLEFSDLPITEDGHFLAYKRVNEDYLDYHTKTFDNHIGKICEMPRNQVDDKCENTCSYGLHFCSLEYLGSFGGAKIMIVKINPRDVVSIPIDYNNTKGRCCRYEVIDEVPENDVKNLQEKYKQSVLKDLDKDDDDYNYYEDEDDDGISFLSYAKEGDVLTLDDMLEVTITKIDFNYQYPYKAVSINKRIFFFNKDGKEKSTNRIVIGIDKC